MLQVHLAFSVLNGCITQEEADLILKKLRNQVIPGTWRNVIEQMEEIIGRRLVIDKRNEKKKSRLKNKGKD